MQKSWAKTRGILVFLVAAVPASLPSCVDTNKGVGPDDGSLGGDPTDGAAGTGPGSGGMRGGTDEPCLRAADCDDGKFCNGTETCDPTAKGGDARGCIEASDGPCGDGECVESEKRCAICENPDGDGDGHVSAACGGDDCADGDDDRFPGNPEHCDPEGHDEDCDPETFGGKLDADKDGDGFVSEECCYLPDGGKLDCGKDCNDSVDTGEGVNPGTPESCNEVDDNCDSKIDIDDKGKDQRLSWYKDYDGDGYGRNETVQLGCFAPAKAVDMDGELLPEEKLYDWLNLAGDCLDEEDDSLAAAVHPGAKEACDDNGLDEDCDEAVDEMCPCLPVGAERPCGPKDGVGNLLETGACKSGKQVCLDTGWAEGCTGSISPTTEVCSEEDPDCSDPNECVDDEDCNGVADGLVTNYDLKTLYYPDHDGDGWGLKDAPARYLCAVDGEYTATATADCNDTDAGADANPGAQEECNNKDDNCDGIVDGLTVDEDLKLAYYQDGDRDGFTSSASAKYCQGAEPDGWLRPQTALDCADGDSNRHPGASETCDGVNQDCDGQDDSVDADAAASCGTPTNVSTAACNVSVCKVASCNGSFLDCNSAFDCEVDGATHMTHCGQCNNACSLACTSSSCEEVSKLSAGLDHTCAVTSKGRVACWGKNNRKQIGGTSDASFNRPTVVALPLVPAQAVAAGNSFTCAVVGGSSQVACWGDNEFSQAGQTIGTNPVSTPTLVDGTNLTNVSALAAGNSHACALVSGSVKCWGRRAEGQLGNGQYNNMGTIYAPLATPTAVLVTGSSQLTSVAQVSAGQNHTCARTSAGAAYCWGANDQGQTGTGAASGAEPRAKLVAGITATQISAGSNHTCAVVSNKVQCWGDNSLHQCGQASGYAVLTPTEVSGLTDAVEVAAGGNHTCVRRATGAVVCFGSNDFGERGSAAPSASSQTLTTTQMGSATVLVAGRNGYTCALGAGSAGYCWGLATNGQLGNGQLSSTHLPQKLAPLN